MDPNDYLEAVLEDQTLTGGSDELELLRDRGKKVKKLLRNQFSQYSVSIQYAGSYKKKTMIRASYDLDILCFFAADTDVGDTLEEIYDAVADVLREDYIVERKRSAVKLLAATDDDPIYVHVDVVPGRFFDGAEGDVWLHQSHGENDRLKTNPEKQIKYVQKSDVRDAIKLAKLWRERYGFRLATFVLELLVIDLLKDQKDESLANQMTHFWTQLRDRSELVVADPGNKYGNDLSDILDTSAKANLTHAAKWALDRVEDDDWEAIFGEVDMPANEQREDALKAAAASISPDKSSRSYSDGGR